jgi:hypothetical protein
MKKTSAPKKPASRAARTTKAKSAARKPSTARKKGASDETPATDTPTATWELTPEVIAEIEQIIEERAAAEVADCLHKEIEQLKKHIIEEVMGTIMPLLEALKKIAGDPAGVHMPGGSHSASSEDQSEADPTSATAQGSETKPHIPSLEEMQKAALESIHTQEKLMAGTVSMVEELQKVRDRLSNHRKRGIKGYWLDQLVKNSSGKKGNGK